jgi:hypothetical protein
LTEEIRSYLSRRELRAQSRRLTQLLVLGYGVGLIALVLGSYKYYVVSGRLSAGWNAVAWSGGAVLVLTLIAPFTWQWPEQVIRRFGNWLGHCLMTALLVPVYFLLFWPVGALLRTIRGSHPIYEWGKLPKSGMEGWHPKIYPPDVADAQARSKLSRQRRVSLFGVLVFFARRGEYLLIPVLLLVVSLGIVLFFLQTSALAPFIYTLF